jgi:hypothetical protein
MAEDPMQKPLLIAFAAATLITPLHAALISYTATGEFNCTSCLAPGTGTLITSSTLDGTSSISFASQTDTVDAPAPNAFAALGLGTFTTSSTIPLSAPGALFQGTFTLTITQTSPAPTGGSPFVSTATYNGTLRTDQSMVVLTFLTTSGSITSAQGTTTINLPQSLIIKDPSQGPTSFQGLIQFDDSTGSAAIPEPATFALTGLGLTLAGLIRRRYRP